MACHLVGRNIIRPLWFAEPVRGSCGEGKPGTRGLHKNGLSFLEDMVREPETSYKSTILTPIKRNLSETGAKMVMNKGDHVEVVDIRQEKLELALPQLILDGINPKNGSPRHMPTLVLYDETGLKLFEKITYSKDYYLTNAEIEVLEKHADAIAERIPDEALIVELGSGNLRKVDILLKAFERAQRKVQYFALDVSLPELKRTFSEISTKEYRYVEVAALHGTYDDALDWLAKPENLGKPKVVMSLGSSIGNFSHRQASHFLNGFAKVLQPSDLMIIGLDACQDPSRVYRAYHDEENVTHQFYRNGLDNANRLLGFEAFKQAEWDVFGRYNEDIDGHEAFYEALADVNIGEIQVPRGQRIKFEESLKYSQTQSDNLWHASGLISHINFGNSRGDYRLHILSPATFEMPTKPESYASKPVPTPEEWENLWSSWDAATRGMIPTDELLSKPIQLRNNLIFYLGHIPTFADMQITKAINGKPTEPAYYPSIFERGIDPDVDNPEHCHAHSEVPADWPPLEEILVFQERVRARVRSLNKSNLGNTDRKLNRVLWLILEHEAMHLETFLYMLLQSQRVLPAPGTETPNFATMAIEARKNAVPNRWFQIPSAKVVLGLSDPENDLGPDRFFGWDNEKPPRTVSVGAFEAQARPITNGEYARFLEQNKSSSYPASWAISDEKDTSVSNNPDLGELNGLGDIMDPSNAFVRGKSVRTVYGLVPLKFALDWPVMASYDELAAYAKWMDGRIPSLEEARSIYNFVENLQQDEAEKVQSPLISAVNGHLSLNGVEESPPQDSGLKNLVNGEQHDPDPRNLFIDLEGCNVGFKHWHPIPMTPKGSKLCGQSDMGGVWEWTSSPLTRHEGFAPMDLYPAYSADFFDDKHNVVLGGSWATHPRIAGRKTFVNWYQRNYPYVWAGARLVRNAA
ncbi:MAG: hypothetical protein Q9227_005822 [Pyrenula ochraceoflavens]